MFENHATVILYLDNTMYEYSAKVELFNLSGQGVQFLAKYSDVRGIKTKLRKEQFFIFENYTQKKTHTLTPSYCVPVPPHTKKPPLCKGRGTALAVEGWPNAQIYIFTNTFKVLFDFIIRYLY